MTIEQWLADASADADRRGLPELRPLLAAVATATGTLRQGLEPGVGSRPFDVPRAAPSRVEGRESGVGVRHPAAADHRDSGQGRVTAGQSAAPRTAATGMRDHMLTIAELAPKIASGQVTAQALTEACLAEIDARNDELRAFITVCADEALAQARKADLETAHGHNRGPLHGIPISVKDLIDLRGTPTTAASRVRDGHMAPADAPIVARLREAGAIFIGKTNLHEFAFGTTSEDSAYGAVRHPRDPSRSPGGSSGGSAVAIVTGMSVASIGTDTGGSVRIPSAACGLVGLKPTWNEIPADGVVPLSQALDHVGPLARSVPDAWLLCLVLRGNPVAARWPMPALPSVKGLRFGVPRPYFFDVVNDEVRARFEEALDRLRAAGATTVDVAIPHASEISAVYLHVSLPEAAAYHAAAIAALPDRYTRNVRVRIEAGRYVLAEDYVRAQQRREVLRAEVDAALSSCDGVVLPTLPIPAPPIGVSSVEVSGSYEPVRNVMLRLTQLFNLTGHPALSIPCGTTGAGLPCGFQMAGRRHKTEDLLAIAAAVELVIRA
ncbi:MAG: amidase [Acidobacteriota bacterium]